jgi:hypothetical protein
MSELIQNALEKAQAILGSECSPIGLMASPEGYPHVWARELLEGLHPSQQPACFIRSRK